jgi:hypothetical protein
MKPEPLLAVIHKHRFLKLKKVVYQPQLSTTIHNYPQPTLKNAPTTTTTTKQNPKKTHTKNITQKPALQLKLCTQKSTTTTRKKNTEKQILNPKLKQNMEL